MAGGRGGASAMADDASVMPSAKRGDKCLRVMGVRGRSLELARGMSLERILDFWYTVCGLRLVQCRNIWKDFSDQRWIESLNR